MIIPRHESTRGCYTNDWLNSRHTFSFGDYHDPNHMGVSLLRVINDDRVVPGAGFPTHHHKNMEIVSVVLEGELEHRDSMDNGGVIRAGDVQRMSAGTGISHSEFNPSETVETRFLQIWLIPNQRNIEPSYEQQHFAEEKKQDQLKLLVSPNGQEGSIQVNSDAYLYGSVLTKSQTLEHKLLSDRIAYIQVIKGRVDINGKILVIGDGATIRDESTLKLTGISETEFLIFNLPITSN